MNHEVFVDALHISFIRIRRDETIIFVANDDFEFLFKCDQGSADGTFRMCQRGYEQHSNVYFLLNAIFPGNKCTIIFKNGRKISDSASWNSDIEPWY